MCAQLRAAARDGKHSAATVLKAGIPTLDDEARRTVRVEMPAEEASLVSSRLEAVRPALQHGFAQGTLAWEGPQFLVYRPGDFFLPHRDRPVEPEDDVSKRRRVTPVSRGERHSVVAWLAET